MGKRRVIAETGAGQHGVATATAAALLGLECVVYMGTEDMARQALNVFRMRLLGAEVRGVSSGSATLKDAINEAMRDWVATADDSYYLLGSALGPHPYPLMVREFQSVIGARGAARRSSSRPAGCPTRWWRASAAAATPSASSTRSSTTRRAADRRRGRGRGHRAGRHAARFAGGAEGVLQGTRTWLLQDADGNIEPTALGLGRSRLRRGRSRARVAARLGRAEYTWADDRSAVAAFHQLARLEGIMPALESAHAIAHLAVLGPALGRRQRHRRQPLGPRRQGRAHGGAAVAGGAMSRLDATFAGLRAARRTGLVAYVTAGDPDLERSAEVIRAVDRGGADVIELGVPFSDPLADGPVIQRATERALAAGVTLASVLDLAGGLRGTVQAPLVLFTYANPVLRMGLETLRAAGRRRRRRRRAGPRPAARGGRRGARRLSPPRP